MALTNNAVANIILSFKHNEFSKIEFENFDCENSVCKLMITTFDSNLNIVNRVLVDKYGEILASLSLNSFYDESQLGCQTKYSLDINYNRLYSHDFMTSLEVFVILDSITSCYKIENIDSLNDTEYIDFSAYESFIEYLYFHTNEISAKVTNDIYNDQITLNYIDYDNNYISTKIDLYISQSIEYDF